MTEHDEHGVRERLFERRFGGLGGGVRGGGEEGMNLWKNIVNGH